jgi:hypothetical protein
VKTRKFFLTISDAGNFQSARHHTNTETTKISQEYTSAKHASVCTGVPMRWGNVYPSLSVPLVAKRRKMGVTLHFLLAGRFALPINWPSKLSRKSVTFGGCKHLKTWETFPSSGWGQGAIAPRSPILGTAGKLVSFNWDKKRRIVSRLLLTSPPLIKFSYVAGS